MRFPKLNTAKQKQKYRTLAGVFLIIAIVMWLLSSKEIATKILTPILKLFGMAENKVEEVIEKVVETANNLLRFTFGIAIIIVAVIVAAVAPVAATILVIIALLVMFEKQIRKAVDRRKAQIVEAGGDPNIKLK